MGSPIGAFFSYFSGAHQKITLLIVLKDDISVFFSSSLKDDPPIAPTVQQTISLQNKRSLYRLLRSKVILAFKSRRNVCTQRRDIPILFSGNQLSLA